MIFKPFQHITPLWQRHMQN